MLLSGCAHQGDMKTVEKVDLDRFMGLWYVHGYTPILVDKDAHNAVEHYYRSDDGRILTTYQFRRGGFDGDLKTFKPTGFVHNEKTQAEWRMQFIWPFKSKYLVYGLSDDYQLTVIAHPNRKYAWILYRRSVIPDDLYAEWVDALVSDGFDGEKILRVPHDWSNEEDRLIRFQEVGDRAPLVAR